MIYICGGLMRTGSIAMWQIMSEIAEHIGKPAPMLGTSLNDVLKIWRKERFEENPLLVTKLHRWESDLDRYTKNIKVVMTVRDFRDVVVSLMHFKGTTFENEVHSRAYKEWLPSYQSWNDALPAQSIMEVRYEDFIDQRTDTVMAVAEFMGVDLGRESAGHIDNKWSIAANIRRSQEDHPISSKEFMSQRHIYSRGKSKWQEELTIRQIEYIETDEMRMWLLDHGYEVKDD